MLSLSLLLRRASNDSPSLTCGCINAAWFVPDSNGVKKMSALREYALVIVLTVSIVGFVGHVVTEAIADAFDRHANMIAEAGQ
jgi:hypothetical protein